MNATAEKFKVGDKAKVIGRLFSHGFKIGEIVNIVEKGEMFYSCEIIDEKYSDSSFGLCDQELDSIEEDSIIPADNNIQTKLDIIASAIDQATVALAYPLLNHIRCNDVSDLSIEDFKFILQKYKCDAPEEFVSGKLYAHIFIILPTKKTISMYVNMKK